MHTQRQAEEGRGSDLGAEESLEASCRGNWVHLAVSRST